MSEPVALGYLRVHLLMTEIELADTEERLNHFATEQGYHLAAIFHEQAHQAPKAFAAMIAAVNNQNATAIIIPSLLHLAVLGFPTQIAHYLQTTTHAQLLISSVLPKEGPR